MTMRIKREELLQQLESVQAGLATREIVEQSSCFVFKDGKVITFNGEDCCQHKSILKVEGAVPAAPLLGILHKLLEEELEVEEEEGELIFIGKKKRFGVTMEKEILLPIDNLKLPKKWNDLHEEFSDAVHLAIQCAGKDENKHWPSCLHIHPKWLECCDNMQITRYRIKTGFERLVLVRASAIKHIVSLGMTEFAETESLVHFRNPSGLVFSCRRFVEDDVPSFDKILKVEGTKTIIPKGLGEAAEKAAVFSSNNNEDKIRVELRPGKVRIIGESSSGWYQEVKKLAYKGEPLAFTISPKMLVELTKKHNECEISAAALKVDGGKWTYVTCLGSPEEEK